MNKRDCEAWFDAIVKTLHPTGGVSQVAHARLLARTAHELLAEERERRDPRVAAAPVVDLPVEHRTRTRQDAHDDKWG